MKIKFRSLVVVVVYASKNGSIPREKLEESVGHKIIIRPFSARETTAIQRKLSFFLSFLT